MEYLYNTSILKNHQVIKKKQKKRNHKFKTKIRIV